MRQGTKHTSQVNKSNKTGRAPRNDWQANKLSWRVRSSSVRANANANLPVDGQSPCHRFRFSIDIILSVAHSERSKSQGRGVESSHEPPQIALRMLLSSSQIAISLVFFGISCGQASAFMPPSARAPLQLLLTTTDTTHWRHQHLIPAGPRLLLKLAASESAAAEPTDTGSDQEDPSTMRLGEIQAELKQRKVSYADCFDKESLVKRLRDARDGMVKPTAEKSKVPVEESPSSSDDDEPSKDDATSGAHTSTSTGTSTFDRDAVLEELRSLRVKELRTKLSERNIRWAGLLEKEDLVRALADAMERASNFSPSGALEPGSVADINDDQLEAEINRAKDVGTPLLLDVYATWCGPCQMMAPQLAAAAAELGESVRVAKIDSDKYSQWAANLRVGGLPTVLVFDPNGKEVNRVEGALMKDGLLDLVRPHI